MMKRLGYVSILSLCFLTHPLSAQVVPLTDVGARALALGRAATALDTDLWGMSNVAAWAGYDAPAGAVMAAQAFGLSELRLGAAAATYPTPLGVAAGTARTYGFDDFRETVLTVGFARAFPVSATRSIRAGAALRYTSVAIPEFGSAGAASLSAGLLVELLPGLDLGAYGHNLNRARLSMMDPLETRLDAGLAFRAHPRALVLLATSKDLDHPLSVRAGVEVRPIEIMMLRAGVGNEPSRFSGGVGIVTGRISAAVATEYHQVLGWTPAFEVGFTW